MRRFDWRAGGCKAVLSDAISGFGITFMDLLERARQQHQVGSTTARPEKQARGRGRGEGERGRQGVASGAAATAITNLNVSAGQWVHIADLTFARYKNISRKLGHVKRCEIRETGSCGKTGQ